MAKLLIYNNFSNLAVRRVTSEFVSILVTANREKYRDLPLKSGTITPQINAPSLSTCEEFTYWTKLDQGITVNFGEIRK